MAVTLVIGSLRMVVVIVVMQVDELDVANRENDVVGVSDQT